MVNEREFYRSFRGPGVSDDDVWSLVFDPNGPGLHVRRLWHALGQRGVEEFGVDEFLGQPGAAQDALLALLFAKEMADAPTL